MKKLLLTLAVIVIQSGMAAANAQSSSPCTEQSVFRFIISRGEVFETNAAGNLTELSLSGFFCPEVKTEGELTPSKGVGSITLTGKAKINSYSLQLQTKATASLSLGTIQAPRGLMLTLIIDGYPLSVLLPYVNEKDSWPAGYIYTYSLAVQGRQLSLAGVTYEKIKK
ncbi:hypothetical protein [uncultured Bacteroides sp.]|uniref:hypothetical protein n=1 Tax=uncultured Bacteroides sp. TaxID=162156 RepID=UPI002AA70D78|nr:hypothetical protein [uncultured Bacteroides sp.]